MLKKATEGEFFTASLRRQFLLLSISLVVWALGALYLGQDINWDLLNYHFYNGYAFIHHRLMQDVAPAVIQTYLNPFLDVLNYYIISIPYPKITVVLLSINTAVLTVFLYKITIILFSNFSPIKQTEAALLAVLIGVTGAANVSLLGTATNDVTISALIVMAFYFLLSASLPSAKFLMRSILFAGLLIGMAVGFKLTASIYFCGLLMSLIVSENCFQYKKKIVGFMLSALLGFVVVNGYWMMVLYQHFQSPLFPYYNNVFHSPLAPFTSFNLSPAEIKPHWQQFLFFPYYVGVYQSTFFSERALRDPRIGMVFLLGTILIFKYIYLKLQAKQSKVLRLSFWGSSNLNEVRWFFSIFFFFSYFVWLTIFAVYRYLLPLELLSGVLLVCFCYALFKSAYARRIFIMLFLVLMLSTTIYPNWGRMKLGKEYFSMNVPQLPPASVVVLAAMPLAYVIPFFAKDTRFIGMPFVGLGENISVKSHVQNDKHRKLLNKVMTELTFHRPQTPLYVLTIQHNGITKDLTMPQTQRNHKRTFAILRHFGIIENKEKCVTFSTNIGDVLQLCPLVFISMHS